MRYNQLMRGKIWAAAIVVAGCSAPADSDDDGAGANGVASSSSAGGAGGGAGGPSVPPGCERSAAAGACTGSAGISLETIDVAGAARQYRLFAPSQGSCASPSGILFFFHGLGGDEHQFDALDPLAETENLLFVQPRGSPQSWAGGALGWVPDGFAENVELLRAIRGSLEQAYGVDAYRVYVAGFSQGAFMAAALASPSALGDAITGVGIFGGGEEENTCPAPSCYAPLACKLPFFMRTGNADQHLPYTQALHDGLLAAGWPAPQLDFQTFVGGHTIREEDVTQMVAWLDGAYPTL